MSDFVYVLVMVDFVLNIYEYSSVGFLCCWQLVLK